MLGSQTGATRPTTAPAVTGPRIVAVCNQKGGVAKTTTCINLAAGLAAAGLRVLVLDLDAQANASRSLGVADAERGAYEFLAGDGDNAGIAVRSAVTGVMVVPGTEALRLAEQEPWVTAMSAPQLRARLTAPDVAVDVVVIDCPPMLGLLSVKAMSAADLILIPVTPTTYGIDALDKTCKTITELGSLHADCVAVLLTIVDAEDLRALEGAEAIRRRYAGFLLPMAVPKDIGHVEAASRNRPLLVLNPEAKGANAYWRLTVAVLRLLRIFAAPAVAVPPIPAPLPASPSAAPSPEEAAAPAGLSSDERRMPPAAAPRQSRSWVAMLVAGLIGLVAGGVLAMGVERVMGVPLDRFSSWPATPAPEPVAPPASTVAPPAPAAAPPAPAAAPPPGESWDQQLDDIQK